MRPEKGKVSSAGSTIWTRWPCAPATRDASRSRSPPPSGSRNPRGPRLGERRAAQRPVAGSAARSRHARRHSPACRHVARRSGRIRPGRPTRSPACPEARPERRGAPTRGRASKPAPSWDGRPWMASDRATARRYARLPIPFRAHRDDRRARSGANRPGAPARPTEKGRNCQKFSPGPARLRPCSPWMMVAAMRRASIKRRGKVRRATGFAGRALRRPNRLSARRGAAAI